MEVSSPLFSGNSIYEIPGLLQEGEKILTQVLPILEITTFTLISKW